MATYKRNKLVFGVGVNDAGYIVHPTLNGVRTICPFYKKWKGMLERCYSSKYIDCHPTYVGCSTVTEWHTFSNFKGWMVQQDWKGKVLDKDLLVEGNKVYGPDTCVFISVEVNNFLLDSLGSRGEMPIGVQRATGCKTFQAFCREIGKSTSRYLGSFSNPEDAHMAWLHHKRLQARVLCEVQTNVRVVEALLKRY